jgi:hypothetical protein
MPANRLKDSLESVGIPVKDIYGREIGKFNGYTLDYAGSLMTIGLESNGSFMELSANRVLSARKEVIVLPDWKAEARDSGFEAEPLDAKMRALTEIFELGEISEKTFESMRHGFVASKERQEALFSSLSTRLEALQRDDDTIDLFLTRVKMQMGDAMLNDSNYATIRKNCSAMKSMNDNERQDLIAMQELMHRFITSTSGEAPAAKNHENEPALPREREDTSIPEQRAEPLPEVPGEAIPQTYGSLRSLGA